jgi:hypothetical protein
MRPLDKGSGKAAKIGDLKAGPRARGKMHQRGSGRTAKRNAIETDGVEQRLTASRNGSGRTARVEE